MQYGNQIFELFKRLESAREYEGTGVGLAIVKRIMEKHQGKIWYESEKGAGTKFYLSFNT
jgi:signal transduction histidine kinase